MASMDRVFRSELLTAVWRFPLPVLCAIGITLIHWPIIDAGGDLPRLSRFSLSFVLVAAFFWTWAAALYGEAAKRPLVSAILCIIGLLVIAYSFDLPRALRIWLLWDPHSDWTNMRAPQLFLVSALVIFSTLAPYPARSASQSAYWQFSHKWFVGLIAAGAGAVAAWIGWWAILETAEILFYIPRQSDLLEKGATIAICLVFPLVWLSLTPSNFAEETRTGDDQEFTARAVALLVTYILIPVTVVLSGLLAAYVVKILFNGTFLTSRLGFTSALYAGGIIGVALMAYPQRSESGYIGLFWRAFPYLLIAPNILLIPALWVRVAEYGWTPARYLALLTVIWVVVIAVAFVLPRWGDLRVIAGTAALLLALTAFGPWGVGPVSGRSQIALLEAHLVQSGWVVDGRWKGPERLRLIAFEFARCSKDAHCGGDLAGRRRTRPSAFVVRRPGRRSVQGSDPSCVCRPSLPRWRFQPMALWRPTRSACRSRPRRHISSRLTRAARLPDRSAYGPLARRG